MENFAEGSATICPNLKTLCLFLLAEDTTKDGKSIHCEEFAKEVWEARRSPPLQSIEWIPYFNDKIYWCKKDAVVYPDVNTERLGFFASMF